MQERRRFVRLDARVKVEYQILESQQVVVDSFTKNVSQGGICLFLSSALKKDTVLDLKLYLPDQREPVPAVGKIVWIEQFEVGEKEGREQYEAGIEFINISDVDRNKIGRYVFGLLRV
jgi:c-di-GMP-binding flagellar brake protein YcgR